MYPSRCNYKTQYSRNSRCQILRRCGTTYNEHLPQMVWKFAKEVVSRIIVGICPMRCVSCDKTHATSETCPWGSSTRTFHPGNVISPLSEKHGDGNLRILSTAVYPTLENRSAMLGNWRVLLYYQEIDVYPGTDSDRDKNFRFSQSFNVIAGLHSALPMKGVKVGANG